MRQRGLTLIELIVTVTVLSLILLMAMPSVASWLGNTHIRNLAGSLQNGLHTARAEAIRRNQPVSFWLVALNDPTTMGNECTLSGNSGSWVVSVDSPIGHCADAPSPGVAPKIVTARAAGSGGIAVSAVQRADPGVSANVVTFDSFGRTTNGDAIGSIDVSAPGNSVNLRILVSAMGSVRVCDPRSSDATDPNKC